MRFFRHGELPLVLLALLDERELNGYELMAELKRLFGPAYRPSPGSVYPAVEALAAEGLVESAASGNGNSFRTAKPGREALATRAQALAALELRTGARLRGADGLDPVLERFNARVAPLSGRVDPEAAEAVLARAAAQIEALRNDPQEDK
jgi:DNA-binding PadR family transcriptional regulator